MKNKIQPVLLLILILSFLPGLSQSIRNVRPFRLIVMTFNIVHGNPPSKPGSIEPQAVAKTINDHKPDLVALQEVDVNTKRSGTGLNEAEFIAAKTGMHFYFAKAIDFQGGEYGVAILSKFPFSRQQVYHLPTVEGTGGEPRILAVTEISIAGHGSISFACTHLDAQERDTNRLVQIKAIVNILKSNPHPVILAGDLNSTPGSEEIDILDDLFTRSCHDCAYTFPADQPSKTIDHVAWTPIKKFVAESHKVINDPYSSDHRPVMATLILK